MKTTSVAIIMCLNIGVDPPDVLKVRLCKSKPASDRSPLRRLLPGPESPPQAHLPCGLRHPSARSKSHLHPAQVSPCARAECWIEPSSMQPQKALDSIGKALQSQYERWQPRARYKLQLDPTVDDVRKLCLSCRRNAKGERVLVHFNGAARLPRHCAPFNSARRLQPQLAASQPRA